ncbi:MAG TPA: DUF2652 domain-containing protein [bacterium]|nr:DUF2652 domain-containing protein [bacterium]
MAAVQQGCLVIGDISGYSRYVAGVELEHSQDVLADLMTVLVGQMQGLLQLANLEGDAVFCYERAGQGAADGGTLLAMLEAAYDAFARRLRLIDRHTTCECAACRLIPTLNLKFLVHHGAFVVHEVAGRSELLGRDVILVHRLLKNAVTARTARRGYALFTAPCLQRFALDLWALEAIEHVETFDDVGEVRGAVIDLEARWRREQDRRAVYLAPGEGLSVAEIDLPAPPALVWHYLTTPRLRMVWQPDTVRVEERSPGGVRGVGTVNHCVHGSHTITEEILDWKPFRYLTDRSSGAIGAMLFTTELSPSGADGTRVSVRMRPDGGPSALAAARAVLPELQALYREAGQRLRTLLESAHG